MNTLIVGLEREALQTEILQAYPELRIVDQHPELVICYGGDGTLLYGERLYPGIPKALIRNSQVCELCANETKDALLHALNQQKFRIQEHRKLEAIHNGQQLIALNDVMIGHAQLNTSVRFVFFVHGKQYGKEMIGDGVVVSTPLGSTGYYQSITRSHFQEGIGIAFNNTVNSVSHVVLHDLADCHIEIRRGPAIVAVDNDENVLTLSAGDEVQIRVAEQRASIVEFYDQNARFNIMTGFQRPSLGQCHICRKQYVS